MLFFGGGDVSSVRALGLLSKQTDCSMPMPLAAGQHRTRGTKIPAKVVKELPQLPCSLGVLGLPEV